MGLLLLRLVAGFGAIVNGVTKLEAGMPIGATVLQAFRTVAGILVLAGLWTPVSASVIAALELWNWISIRPADPWPDIFLATIGAALALVGPGAWSVDARLFGWKRIDLRDRRG